MDTVVGGCVGLARLLSVDPAVLRTSKAAADFLVRRGFPAPSDTEVLYAAVETDANRRVTCVVGVFRSAREARAYAQAAGWADHQVAPYSTGCTRPGCHPHNPKPNAAPPVK